METSGASAFRPGAMPSQEERYCCSGTGLGIGVSAPRRPSPDAQWTLTAQCFSLPSLQNCEKQISVCTQLPGSGIPSQQLKTE